MTPIFCPACKRVNESSNKVCEYCGASLEHDSDGPSTTAQVARDTNALSPAITADILESIEAPIQGIAVYIHDFVNPLVIQVDQEVILGRVKTDPVPDNFLDLTPYGAYENGVSQKHAVIRRTETGYQIFDNGSTNGTWLNRKRLIPKQPYRLESGAHIHLGRLSLYVIFH